MYNFANPNPIALAVNISRVYEIAKAGNHTVKIVASEHCKAADIDLLHAFYKLPKVDNADMIVELCYDYNAVFSCFNACETLEEIDNRIAAISSESIDDTLDNSSIQILKSATNKLQLGLHDVIVIHKLAKTIARLAKSDKILVEHIAEAIQYRSI